jgi:cobalt-zinc-cadmium efflux system outer membrane protein
MFFNSDLQPHFLDFKNSGESYLGVNQTFELPRKRAIRGKIAEQESREVETDIDLVKLEVILQVKTAFYELLLAREKLEYSRRDLELAEDYLQKAELKRAAGDVAQVEVLRAKVEALKAANAVRVAVSNENLAKARLNYHLARRRETPLQITGQLQVPFVDLSIEDLKREAQNLRPELSRLQFSIEKETRTQEAARLSNWPDLDFNLSKHRLEGERTTWSFTVQVPLPFLFKQRQKAVIAEAQANVGMLERETDQVRNSIVLDVEEAYTDAQKAQSQILLYQQEILPQAQEVYDMFLFSYQEGEIGGIELIEARRTLNESRKSYADALFEYALALATLEKAVGRRP